MFKFWGKVRAGKKRGKSLGFPTANISLHKKIPEGIYISEIKLNKKIYSALTFIGEAKTFGETDYLAETYILGFDQVIYNKWISIKLLKKIRGNKHFDSAEELVNQMKQDEAVAREYFKSEK